MKTNRLILPLLLMLSLSASAWNWWPLPMANADSGRDSLFYTLSLSGVASSGKTAPFWLQSNRHGDIAASPYSGNLTAGIIKPATRPCRWFDYDFAFTLTGRLQSRTDYICAPENRTGQLYTNLAYAHVRLYIIDITAGIQPEQYGSPDPELTGGGLLYSANARPMPGIRIGIDRWTAFPGLYGYLEVKGGVSHQYLFDNVYVTQAKVHHKWIGARVGGRLPVNLSYEFHHVAQWGGYSPVYGDLGNDWSSFLAAVLVRSGGSMANDQLNAQGNHIGSQSLTLDVKGDGWRVSAYWQNLFEDGPIRFIGFGMNQTDGLWGVNVSQSRWPFISGFTYEFLNTTDQSGPYHDRDGLVYGGNDSYYRNGVYQNGWNYHYRTIGTPFITSPVYNTDGTVYTLNNRVQAHYVGVRGDIYGFRYRLVGSFVRNFGNDSRTTPEASRNTGVLLEVDKRVKQAWGLEFGLSLSADFGTQFSSVSPTSSVSSPTISSTSTPTPSSNRSSSQFGVLFTVRKTGLLTQW